MDIGENEDGQILTTEGWVFKALMTRTLIVEDRPDAYVVSVEWRRRGELVRRDALPAAKSFIDGESDSRINTIYNLVDAATLNRTITFTESEMEFTIVRQFTSKAGGEVVRRDAHIILKHASDALSAVAGGLG